MRFNDQAVRNLNSQNPSDMIRLLELFCGESIETSKDDKELLSSIVGNIESLTCEQLNEILLVLNQDRITRHFFDFFIASNRPATFKELRNGIEKFRGFAMLCYGNFKFAFKKLNSVPPEEFRQEIREACPLTNEEVKRKYQQRPKKAKGILRIDRRNTWFVGYLSGRKLDRDTITLFAILLASGRATRKEIAKRLDAELREKRCLALGVGSLSEVKQRYGEDAYRQEEQAIRKEVERITNEASKTAKSPALDVKKWQPRLEQIRRKLTSMREDLRAALNRAKKNTNVYLTWDYMDVYVATSMREKWEYEATFDFLREVFNKPDLRKLNVRYFESYPILFLE